MLRRKKTPNLISTPSASSTEVAALWGDPQPAGYDADPWAVPTASGGNAMEVWGATPETRTGSALLGEQNTGSAAVSAAIDGGPSKFWARDVWGSGGRVVRGVESAQQLVGAVDGFMDSGAGRIAKKLPGIGRYARALDKGAELGKAVSDGIDSFGGADGIARGVEGAIRDPRAALDMAVNGGGKAVIEGAKVAAGNLAEQVGLGEMTPEGRLKAKFNIGRMATVGAELLATGGTSSLAMLTEAGATGAAHGIRSATEYAKTMPGQFAAIPQAEQAWGQAPTGWDAQPAMAGAGWGNGAQAAPTYSIDEW